ncbi:MAG TPA: tRNA uridine-5-carboxymethylaminomethyl(34) synthesis GTPase MnmE [Rectinemataceae bacterium]|nr:tRNA uridine-5-carboxymethylaminomethyl(34) synthesis GTPase MnmE [Rectinemataceae bacterium]
MARTYLDTGRPIVALATPPGRSALAVIRASGEKAIELCARCFSAGQDLAAAPGYSMRHGFLVDPDSGERVDEIVAAVFRAPRSFTGENSVEISCHGSAAVTSRALAALEKAGFAPALPGEFSFRAFINGKTDLVKAEAINELAGAQCESAREDALLRLSGVLSNEFSAIRGEMLDLLAEIEARLDYPADDIDDEGLEESLPWLGRLSACERRLAGLSRSYIGGRLRQEGALVVVTGRPNAGKSSLFNLVVREERAIVSPEPGTTRDWLEAWIEVGGYAVRLVDTAGLRQAEEGVEAEGVRRSLDLSGKADIVAYLVDGRAGLAPEDADFISRHPAALKIWNKIDSPDCQPAPPGWLGLSAQNGYRLEALEAAIKNLLDASTEAKTDASFGALAGASTGDGGSPGSRESSVRVASARQKGLIDRCLESIRGARAGVAAGEPLDATALDVREAAGFLGEITGEIAGEEVFDRIFGSFCLGK